MADNADSQLPSAAGEEDTHANSATGSQVAGESTDDDVTVLTNAPALVAEEFPQGLSPRELALTLKGQLLGHFHLQEFVGGGGMGAVFKALDTTLDRIVAVKVVASQSISSEDLQRRFLIEAQSTARLDHPNIARIHFVGRDRGLPYIVFEYIDGVNLRDLVLNHGAIPLGDALSYTCQIAHALAHAWQKEVVHRDIKPSNILVTREGQAKLVDMGLARFRQVGAAAENDLTTTGVTLGTFDYISPEQARDPREVDTRSDIYSLGCTLFYMLAGRPPFAEGTAVQKLLQHQDQSPPELSQLRPDIPESVSQLVSQMLAKSPELRPQTPTELVVNCYKIFNELGIQPPASLAPLSIVPQSVSPSLWRTHLPWAIPVAALMIFLGVWAANDSDSTDTVEFSPLQHFDRPLVEQIETPEAVRSEDLTNVLKGNTVERTQQKSAGVNAREESRIHIGSILDSVEPSPNLAGPSLLLNFSAEEPAAVEGYSGDTSEGLNLDNIFITE